jgi:hypothetical protein
MVYNGEISAEQKALAIYCKAGIWNIIQRDSAKMLNFKIGCGRICKPGCKSKAKWKPAQGLAKEKQRIVNYHWRF